MAANSGDGTVRNERGQFVPGKSGNPTGKRKDSVQEQITDFLEAPFSPQRFDGWVSALTGIGTTERDKRTSHAFAPSSQLTYEQIANLWEKDDIAAKAIELPAHTCFQEGYEISIGDEGSYDELKEDLEEALEDLGVDKAVERALNLSRAFGGAAILIGANDNRPLDTPLEMERVASLDWLNVLEPTEIYPASFYSDPTAPKYGEPEFFQVNNFGTAGTLFGLPSPKPTKPKQKDFKTQYIHESRLVIFDGIKVSRYSPTTSNIAPYWGHSIINRFIEVLRDYNVSFHSAGIIGTDISQPVISMENLMGLVAKSPEKLAARMSALELSRSTARAILIDSKEKFERVTTNISGLPDLLDRLSQRLAGAIDIPLSVLLGVAPEGMGQAGETELKQWYARIRAIQRRELTPVIRKLAKMIMQSLRKRKIPKKWDIRWHDLERLTDTQRAEARLTQARSDSMYIKMGAVTCDEIRFSRFGGQYSYETQIKENEDAPGIPEIVAAAEEAALMLGAEGQAPATAGKSKAAARRHPVRPYARKSPKAPTLGRSAIEGGDKANGKELRDRQDAAYTAEAELDYQTRRRQRLLDAGASPDSAAVKLLNDLIELTEAELMWCRDGSCGPDCLYDHPWRVDEDGPGKVVDFAGFRVCIESPKGSVRTWIDTDGTPGETKMKYDYGYIENSMGTDGDSVDVYLGPNEQAEWVYIIHQNKKPDFTQYDEDKVMLGFDSANHAQDAYLRQYDDERFLGGVTQMKLEEFHQKIQFHTGGRVTHALMDAGEGEGTPL